jgi:hypothetical protein
MNPANSSENIDRNRRRSLEIAAMTVTSANWASSALQMQRTHNLKTPKRRKL